MTEVITKPEHVHGHSRFERVAGGVRAYCVCGAFWTRTTKPEANQALGRHLREQAREFRKLRAELRSQGATVPSESGDQYVMEEVNDGA